MNRTAIRPLLIATGFVAGAALLALALQSNNAEAKPTTTVTAQAPTSTPLRTVRALNMPTNGASKSWCASKDISSLKRSCFKAGKCKTRPSSEAYVCYYNGSTKLGEIPMYKHKGAWGSQCENLVDKINAYCK